MGRQRKVNFTIVFLKKVQWHLVYLIHNEGKSVVVERFTNYIVNKYSNTNIRTIKIRPVDVKDNPYIDITKEVNDKASKFKVGVHLRISKYKNIFAKG